MPTIDDGESLADGKRHVSVSASARQVKITKPSDGLAHSYGVRILTVAEQGAVEGKPARLPPPPPPAADTSLAQSWIILAENPEHALNSPDYYKLAVTADPAYRHFLTGEFLRKARAQGRTVYAWCDCDQTPPQKAIDMARDFSLDGWMGQGETAEQFDNACNAGCKVAVVNLAALRPDQLETIRQARIFCIVELYRNCQPFQEPDWKNVNPGVGGNCIAVYRDGQCPGMPLSQYVADGMFVARRDSVYGSQMTPDDYRNLP